MSKYKLIAPYTWEIFKDDSRDITLFYNKINNTFYIHDMCFILNDGVTLESMMAEREDLRHSARYGHWQIQIPEMTQEMVEFMNEVFKAESEEKVND